MKRELFALGAAVYEITTWERPFQGLADEEVEAKYAREEFPSLACNIAGPVILSAGMKNLRVLTRSWSHWHNVSSLHLPRSSTIYERGSRRKQGNGTPSPVYEPPPKKPIQPTSLTRSRRARETPALSVVLPAMGMMESCVTHFSVWGEEGTSAQHRNRAKYRLAVQLEVLAL